MDSEREQGLVAAVGRIMREKFAALEQATKGVRIMRVEQAAEGRALLVFGDGSTLTLEMPPGVKGPPGPSGIEGPQGADGPRGATGDTGPQGERGERGEVGPMGAVGERGAQGYVGPQGPAGPEGIGIESVEQSPGAGSFALRFTNGEVAEVELPAGIVGARGDPGEPGRDRFIAAPRQVRDGEAVDKNDLISWGGGIVQAIRATTRSPDSDPASYICIVAGIASLTMIENLGTRTFDLTARLTNGIEQTCRARAMPRFMGDGPRPDERVIRGDQILRGHWLYTAIRDDADPVPLRTPAPSGRIEYEAHGWRRYSLRGEAGDKGAKGDRGERGETGVGVADVSLDPEGVLTVKLTNGEERYCDARALLAVEVIT